MDLFTLEIPVSRKAGSAGITSNGMALAHNPNIAISHMAHA
jgi:hypothetical protein